MWLLETVSCWLLYWLTNFLLAVGLDQPQLLVSKPSHHGCLLPKSQKGSEFSHTVGVDNIVTEAMSYFSCILLFRQVTDHSHTLGNGCGYRHQGALQRAFKCHLLSAVSFPSWSTKWRRELYAYCCQLFLHSVDGCFCCTVHSTSLPVWGACDWCLGLLHAEHILCALSFPQFSFVVFQLKV